MFKVIRFDDSGCIWGQPYPSDPQSVKLEKMRRDFVSFGNKVVLNKWADTEYDFCIGTNGICSENFFEEVPWYMKVTANNRIKYWWGNDCLKKLKLLDPVVGACPFVYSLPLYEKRDYNERFQFVFLPKADACPQIDQYFTMKTDLNNAQDKRDEFLQTIKDLNLKNPVYICAPPDYDYWEEFFPKEMEMRLFCLGFNRYDSQWNDTLISVFNHATELYFHMISTPSVYSSYMGKKVSFYDTNLLHLDKLGERDTYTLDKTKKAKIYHEFMEYITDVFANKTRDMGFWITEFLSLNLIKDPTQLSKDLLTLDNRSGKITRGVPTMSQILNDSPRKAHTNYDTLVEMVAKFNTPPSDKAYDYFTKL